jgi:hypothetical protein
LRISLAQFIGQAIPVAESTHWPHMRQSNKVVFARRSTGRNAASTLAIPMILASGASHGASDARKS